MTAYGEFAEYYDLLMQDAPYERWMTFLEEAMARYDQKPRHIADLGCGTGTISHELFQRGYTVTGVDLSEEMLMIAESKRERPSPKLRFFCQDLRELVLSEPVDLAISFCDSLNYLLEEEDLRATFARVRQHVKPGGCFLFDLHSAYKLREKLGNHVFFEDQEEVTYLWQSRYDDQRQLVEYDISFFVLEDADEGLYRRFQEVHLQRAYDVEFMRSLLHDVGFTTVEVYADFRWDVPTNTSERLFFVAR